MDQRFAICADHDGWIILDTDTSLKDAFSRVIARVFDPASASALTEFLNGNIIRPPANQP